MERLDVEAWLLARQIFKCEHDNRFWSGGLLGRRLAELGYPVASAEEKDRLYDRATCILERRRPARTAGGAN